MNSKLKSIFDNHNGKLSDTWTLYINKWDEIFTPFQDREINLLEIGTQNGGSIEILAKFFPKAKHLVSCDIEENCQRLKFIDPRITVITGDINSITVQNHIAEIVPDLDIIIDDGSHLSRDIIQSFCKYFKRLNDQGIYLIEDLHTNYWRDYDGGLYQPYTAMAFFKRLVDITNFEHWQNHQSREEYLAPFIQFYSLDFDDADLYQVHSIKFINSLCIIQKRPLEENTLGRRLITGSEEAVCGDYRKFNRTTIHDMPKRPIDDMHLDIFSLISETEKLQADLVRQKKTIQQYQDMITENEQTIEMLNTKIDEKDQFLHQTKLSLEEKQQTIRQIQAILLEKEQSIDKLKVNIGEQSETIFNHEAKIKHNEHIIQKLQQETTEYNQRVETLNQQVQEFKQEVLFYALSKSWRITRPLRKLMDVLREKRHN